MRLTADVVGCVLSRYLEKCGGEFCRHDFRTVRRWSVEELHRVPAARSAANRNTRPRGNYLSADALARAILKLPVWVHEGNRITARSSVQTDAARAPGRLLCSLRRSITLISRCISADLAASVLHLAALGEDSLSKEEDARRLRRDDLSGRISICVFIGYRASSVASIGSGWNSVIRKPRRCGCRSNEQMLITNNENQFGH